MSWKLLQSRGGSWVNLGYSINSGVLLKFTISEELMKKCGWSDKTRLQLWVDEEVGLARLDAVRDEGRKVRVIGVNGRAHCCFTWTDAEAVFFEEREGVYALDVESAASDAIYFKLPPAEEVEA